MRRVVDARRRRGRADARVVTTLGAIVAVVVVACGYLVAMTDVGGTPEPSSALVGDLQFVDLADGRNAVERIAVENPGGPRSVSGISCLRSYQAAGTTVCLRLAGAGPVYAADVLDDAGTVTRSVPLPGVPSRARVSASGAIVSWTTFVAGDSYAVPGGFSTRTGLLDLRNGEVLESIESFAAQIDGAPYSAVDVNLWGVSMAADDRTFYATLGTQGQTWLVRGDLPTRTLVSVRRDAECPSLSPDGTKVAYKKRIGRLGPWDLAVLDLVTNTEVRLPGTAGVDDQAEWLDEERLAYGAVPPGGRTQSIFVVEADGARPAELLLSDAASPSIVRP